MEPGSQGKGVLTSRCCLVQDIAHGIVNAELSHGLDVHIVERDVLVEAALLTMSPPRISHFHTQHPHACILSLFGSSTANDAGAPHHPHTPPPLFMYCRPSRYMCTACAVRAPWKTASSAELSRSCTSTRCVGGRAEHLLWKE